MTYIQVFNFQKMTYIIVLKVTKFGEDQLNRLLDIQQKHSGGRHFAPPSPVKIRVRLLMKRFDRIYVKVSNRSYGVLKQKYY